MPLSKPYLQELKRRLKKYKQTKKRFAGRVRVHDSHCRPGLGGPDPTWLITGLFEWSMQMPNSQSQLREISRHIVGRVPKNPPIPNIFQINLFEELTIFAVSFPFPPQLSHFLEYSPRFATSQPSQCLSRLSLISLRRRTM